MKKRDAQVKATVRLNAYPIIADAVEGGVGYGFGRAFKHTDKPTPDALKEAICQAVMNELCEILIFDGGAA